MTISNIKNYPEKVSGLIIDSILNHAINISKYNPLSGSVKLEIFAKLNKRILSPLVFLAM